MVIDKSQGKLNSGFSERRRNTETFLVGTHDPVEKQGSIIAIHYVQSHTLMKVIPRIGREKVPSA
jgi:hypothetical protein